MVSLFKITGLILTVISCSTIGFYKAAQIRRRKALLKSFQELMEQVSTEMQYFKEPLPSLFQHLLQRYRDREHQKAQTSITILLQQCVIGMTKEHVSFDQIWKNAIEETYRDEPLNDEDLQTLMRCGHFLGQSDYRSQEGHFDLLRGELEAKLRDVDAEIRTKGSLYAKAGVSVGAVIAIALL